MANAIKSDGQKGGEDENKFVEWTLIEDLKNFEFAINNFENNLKNLNEGDKRKWEAFISLKLLQDNLNEFKSIKIQISQLNHAHKDYQDAIVQIFGKFIRDHEDEIKERKKSDVLKSSLNSYLKHFQKDFTLKAMMNVKVHKELECRTVYATKLGNILKDNTDLKATVKLGKNVLVIESGNVPEIRMLLTGLKKQSKQATTAQKDFEGKLKQLLDKP